MISKNNPLITEHFYGGGMFRFKYRDVDSFNSLRLEKIRQVYGICFYSNKMIMVKNG